MNETDLFKERMEEKENEIESKSNIESKYNDDYDDEFKMEEPELDQDDDLAEEIFTAEGASNTKDERFEEFRRFPNKRDTGYTNSKTEGICLDIVEHFERQFKSLYPDRSPLVVQATNEFGIQKCVCTTMRPIRLSFETLHTATQISSFMSHHIQYEPLKDATAAPTSIASPAYTLKNQVGDSFDNSVLLCSLLIGAGYDAYCVYGYAPIRITLLDRSKEKYPMKSVEEYLDTWEDKDIDCEMCDIEHLKQSPRSTQDEEETLDKDAAESKMDDSDAQANNEPEETSAEAEENAEAVGETENSSNNNAEGETGEGNAPMTEEEVLAAMENAPVEEEEEEDPYRVEPIAMRASEYMKSLRIQGQKETKEDDTMLLMYDSDNEDEPDEDPLEGKRVHCWVLVRAGARNVKTSYFVEPTTGRKCHIDGSPYTGVESIWNNENYWVNMQSSEDGVNISFDVQDDGLWEAVFTQDQTMLSPGLDGNREPVGFGNEHKMAEGDSKEVFKLPVSWVAKPQLTKEAYRRKYGKTGQRLELFHKCKVESYGNHIHPHGLERRVTTYRDRNRSLPVEIREYYQNRRDLLLLRVRYLLDGRILESFRPGRKSSLKCIDQIPGKRMTTTYYTEARLDGLVKRDDVVGRSMLETFNGRDDLLQSRFWEYVPLEDFRITSSENSANRDTKVSELAARNIAMTMTINRQGEDCPLIKMKEIYDRDPKAPKGAGSVHKQKYDLQGRTISMIYHFEPGNFMRVSKKFSKDPKVEPEIKLVGYRPKPLSATQIADDFQQALLNEKQCYAAVKNSERDYAHILSLRDREECMVVLDTSVFDRDWSNPDEAQGANSEKTEVKDPRIVDYLTPFLSFVPDPSNIRPDEATEARDNCLKSMKERLMERADIIRQRLDEENNTLSRQQATHQRSRERTEESDQKFEEYCSEAMFRIQILEQRLARHEESAMQSYSRLEMNLREDPRLSMIYEN